MEINSLKFPIAMASMLMAASSISDPPDTTNWRSYVVTGYSHGCTMPRGGKEHKHPRKGANNKWPIPNLTVAADPSIPFGTRILISYDGIITERIVGDRGRAIKGNRLDLFMENCRAAKIWGKRKVSVLIG